MRIRRTHPIYYKYCDIYNGFSCCLFAQKDNTALHMTRAVPSNSCIEIKEITNKISEIEENPITSSLPTQPHHISQLIRLYFI